MPKFKIVSSIEIKRSGRNRTSRFLVRSSLLNKDVLVTKTANSIQALLDLISKSFDIYLFADDYTFNFPLRQDEFIPNKQKRPLLGTCIECDNEASFQIETKPYCANHYYAEMKTLPVQRLVEKQHRNAMCECGSNRKFKHCCISKIEHHSGRLHFNPKSK